ncbi:hypothetical protein FEZ63_22230 [Microvirga brassicacearum]|uniref:HD domain-containing protein n=1 Tax=Microvirga brassicacearum TaxID=2580413 RepID=A0A5N3P4K8_9HYPH|nr:hypothetical protein FEZ63_22230 [Microvirga brassicacearum]
MIDTARCFYSLADLAALFMTLSIRTPRNRPYYDKRYTIDHFQTKLLKLASGFQTGAGARVAQLRHKQLRGFLDEFMDEI